MYEIFPRRHNHRGQSSCTMIMVNNLPGTQVNNRMFRWDDRKKKSSSPSIWVGLLAIKNGKVDGTFPDKMFTLKSSSFFEKLSSLLGRDVLHIGSLLEVIPLSSLPPDQLQLETAQFLAKKTPQLGAIKGPMSESNHQLSSAESPVVMVGYPLVN